MENQTPLRRFRTETLNLSLDEMARVLNTSKATLSRIERGLQPATIDLVRSISGLSKDKRAQAALARDLMIPEGVA